MLNQSGMGTPLTS